MLKIGGNMRILLCCNAGMSSSILVKKMEEVARENNEDIQVKAVASAAIKDEVGKWDVCLVGPQLIFAVENIKSQLSIPVVAIEARTYALADGKKALDLAKSLL